MSLDLDPDVCYRSIQTKDARFDGQFFVAVCTTGIYCRPICPAITPKQKNCIFFLNAAAAQSAGFRPCLRCRPELSPNLFAQVGTASTVSRALSLIARGALDEGTVGDLATRLGVGDRHLRQLFAKHLGTSPTALAQTRRILFAKLLAQIIERLQRMFDLNEAIQTFCQLPGIGAWTANYIAMRALREPDAFPAADLGLLKAMESLGHPVTKAQLIKYSQAWRTWRAYAATHLWSSLDLANSTLLPRKEMLSA
jgi:methylphosphotriester-DNA--protein-cysteine methyltransferase